MTEPVFIIAEAGVNHNGNLKLAKQLIDAAAASGADAVKFQTFQADQLVSGNAPKAEYQIFTTDKTESQFDMIRNLELTEANHEVLVDHAKNANILFMSTPFDSPSLELLVSRLKLETIKIPSGEITNAPFLLEIARVSSKVILSTGMSTLDEVESALSILAFGFTTTSSAIPKKGDFDVAYASDIGQEALRRCVTLLHCTTEYPAPFNEVNLRAMNTMANAFSLPVGYSDHTKGIHISLAAVALGATVIEKHFTLSRELPGPDHKASLEPDELRQMVEGIREIEMGLGDGIKAPSPSELKNRDVARKSLVASKSIDIGEVFTQKNLTCKRPGNGRSPYKYWETLGEVAKKNYDADELLNE